MSILALIIAVLPVFVNAEAPAVMPTEARALADHISKNGTQDKIGARTRFLNIPPESESKFQEVLAKDTSDGLDRTCELVFDSSETTKPMCLLIRVSKDNVNAKKAETHYFQLSPSGALQKIVFLITRFDDAGKTIRGSAVFEEKPATPELMQMLRKELDFWLKGKYRKKAPAKAAAKKQ